jgi:hypothetical protein
MMTLRHRLSRRNGLDRRSQTPNRTKKFVEFDDDKLPPYCTIDRELSDKLGRTVRKWTYEKYP